jgi:hypothetical protein
VGVMPDNGVVPPLPRPVGPTKVGTSKTRKVPMSRGADAKPEVESAIHHLDDAGNYLQVCNFSNSQAILLNYVTNDFLQ